MYAVIETGGKQYRVQAGEFLQVEKLDGAPGSVLSFGQVLFASAGVAETPNVLIGLPHVPGAVVQAQMIAQGRGDKILIVKMKRRKQYRRTQGHRQEYSQILITGIKAGELSHELSPDEISLARRNFHTQLKPKGLAKTPKTLGSRVRRRLDHQKRAIANRQTPVTPIGTADNVPN